MVKIENDNYTKSFYIPCGNLDTDYINLQMKIKIMQMLMGGEIDIAYLEDEVGMDDFLAMLTEEYSPNITLVPTNSISYDKDSETYLMEFRVIPNSPDVNMEDYLLIDTERFMALGVYLQVGDDDFDKESGEYMIGPHSKIDYQETFLNMQQEAMRWLPFMDISKEGLELIDILDTFKEMVVGVVYLGEVAVVVMDTIGFCGEDFFNRVEEPTEQDLDFGINGSNQNILFGFDNHTTIDETNDDDWSTF